MIFSIFIEFGLQHLLKIKNFPVKGFVCGGILVMSVLFRLREHGFNNGCEIYDYNEMTSIFNLSRGPYSRK